MKHQITRISRALRSEAAPILISELLFNFGFFAIVPFIALSLSNDFGAGAATIGFVLGLRSFGQRGMFLVGGALADRLGARAVILIGIAIRTVGFASLSFALLLPQPSFWVFVVGTFLTGVGGAFFGPGFQVIIAAADIKKKRRITLFAWLTVTSEIGSVVGPVAGAFLIDIKTEVNSFAIVSGYGALLFAAVGVVLWFVLPRGVLHLGPPTGPIDLPTAAGPDATIGPTGLFRGRRIRTSQSHRLPRKKFKLPTKEFIWFSALSASDNVAYNQLYLTVPLLLDRLGHDPKLLGALFAWVSVLTFAFQLPISRLSTRMGAPRALRFGYLSTTAGFAGLAVAAFTGADREFFVIAGCLTFVILGHLSVNPTSLSAVPLIAKPKQRGIYFGVLASLGGVLVLFSNPLVGAIFESPGTAGVAAAWLFLAAMSLISAIGAPRLLAKNLRLAGH